MELTKKDQRRIRNLAAADLFKITVNASEYAEAYRIAYLKEMMKYLQEKIEFLEMRYNKNYNNEQQD
nr:MAG TPA: hypothetical protein [Caudoviricetes sp.]